MCNFIIFFDLIPPCLGSFCIILTLYQKTNYFERSLNIGGIVIEIKRPLIIIANSSLSSEQIKYITFRVDLRTSKLILQNSSFICATYFLSAYPTPARSYFNFPTPSLSYLHAHHIFPFIISKILHFRSFDHMRVP